MPRLSRTHTQLLLFLGAVLAPSILLVATAVREHRRGEIVAAQLAAESRTRTARQIANQLRVTLEELRYAAAENGPRTEGSALLVARPMPLARQGARRTATVAAGFSARLRAAESSEFAGRTTEAADAYAGLLRAADDPVGAAIARLALARTLARAGRTSEATRHYRTLLALPFDIRDEDGIPLALYAAERLHGFADHAPAVAARLRERLGAAEIAPLIEAHMLSELADSLPAGAMTDTLRAMAASHLRNAVQLSALERDVPALFRLRAAPVGAGGTPAVPGWIAYGDPLWLVTLQPSRESADTLLLVVEAAAAARTVTAALAGVVTGPVILASANGDEAGVPLTPEFPAVHAHFTPAQPLTGRSIAGVPLLLLMVLLAAVAAWLLWRDVRRESRVAALRSRFVSAVSHELKTPLTSIRMFAEMLRMEPADEQQRSAFAETIVGESERLSRLIENVLHFTRMEEGKQHYHFAPTPVQEVVRGAAQAMEYQMLQRGLRMNVEIDEAIPPLALDRDAMTHAVLNLLSNAVKFSPEGGDVELRLERSNGSACIRVTDQGVGIAPADQPRVFEEYYRAPDADARGIAGTGLGLALVAGVARAHGGDVQLRSAPGEGSSFTLRIPLEQQS